MNRKSLKTAAFLLIFALLASLPAGFISGEARISALKKGDSGEAVVSLQRDLRALSLLDFKGEPNGEFDDVVELAVIELQRILGVEADGIYGANTRRAYNEALESGFLAPFYIEELPLYGCTVGIDAGHQAEADLTLEPISPFSANKRYAMSEGCLGVRTSNRESVINLEVSLELTRLLKSFGAEVVTSRDTEEVSISNSARAVLMNESGVDFWLRIHCDHSADPSLFGARILLPNSIFNYNISAKSALLGRSVIKKYCEAVGTVELVSRSLTTETGFNWSTVPVAALELGYLSNAATDLALSSPEYRQKCAEGILHGIAEYCFNIGLIDIEDYWSVLGITAVELSDGEFICPYPMPAPVEPRLTPPVLHEPLLSFLK